MKTFSTFQVVLILVTLAATLSFTSFPVVAQSERISTTPEQRSEKLSQRIESVKLAVASKAAQLKLRVEDHQTISREKLGEVKLKACQKRRSAITKHVDNTSTVASRLELKFTTIATKVETFKATKSLAVDNYEALLTDVSNKKGAVDAAIAQAKTDGQNFSCTSDGPKAQLQTFVSQMDVVRSSLSNYRTSIKSLTQAVRQANQATQASSSARQETN